VLENIPCTKSLKNLTLFCQLLMQFCQVETQSSKKNMLNAIDQGQGDNKNGNMKLVHIKWFQQKLVFHQPVMPNVRECDKISGKGKT